MYNKMIAVLTKSGNPIPGYAILLGEDLKMEHGKLICTVYETPCFWSGETSMALHPAVKYTEAGWINSSEVVKVFFDESQVSLIKLNSYAINEGFFVINDHQGYKTDERPQYYLAKSSFSNLPLSRAQRSKINLALPYNKQPSNYLSPKQAAMYQDISKGIRKDSNNCNYKKDIATSWTWN
jgi:hypothetical protein